MRLRSFPKLAAPALLLLATFATIESGRARIDDREGKPININLHIGRRPILAFGNSDGDLQMLEYTTGAPGARLSLLVHHDDATREFAYDHHSRIGQLDKALTAAKQNGWTLVSMKTDWKTIFPTAESKPSAR